MIKENRLYIISWFIFTLSIITTLSQLKDHFYLFINSDSLCIPSLYNDLIFENGQIKDWYWTPAPYLFPDVFNYFLLAAIFKLSAVKTLFLVGIFQIIALTYLLIYIFKKLANDNFKKYKWLIPIFLSMYFIESFYFSYDPFFSFLLYACGYHVGAFLNTLILICFFLNSSPKIVKYIFFFLFSVIGSFSDKLYLVMLAAPLILALLFTLKKENLKHSFISILFVITGCFLGLLLFNWVADSKLITLLPPYKMYAFDNIIPSWNMFLEQMTNCLKIIGFRSFQILFTFLSIPVCLIYFIKKRKVASQTQLFLVLFYAFFGICTFFAPIINGSYTNYDTLRYNVYPFFFAAVVFAGSLGYLLEIKVWYPLNRMVSLSILTVFILIVSFKFNLVGFKNYLNYYPDDVSEIDSVANQYNLKRGISNYWKARKTTILSKEKVVILSVYDGCNIYELGGNINWYYDNEFDFILANGILPDKLKTYFNIKDTITTKNHTILLIDKFIYPKGKYFPETVKKAEL